MYSPWVGTALTILNDGSSTTVSLNTDKAAHLHLVTQPEYPTLTPRWRPRRGALIQCGWWIDWPAGTCHDQVEPGNTTTHTWHLSPVAPPASLWASASATCPPSYNAQQTVPFDVAKEVTTVPLPAICGYAPSTAIPSGGLHDITWASAVYQHDWPGQSFPASLIRFPSNGIVQVSAGILWPATGTQYNAAFFIDYSADNPWLENDLTELSGGNGNAGSLSAPVQVAAGDTMRLRVAQSSGSTKHLGATDGQTLYLAAAYIRLLP